jgi:hypothetical protein
MNNTKTCRECCAPLTAQNSAKDKSKKNGIALICKTCKGKIVAEWRKRNPDKVKLQRQRAYQVRKQSPRAVKQKQQYNQTWYQKIRKSGVSGKVQILLSSIRARVKQGKIPMDLDLDYLVSIATDDCPVDGLPLDWEMNSVTEGKATDRSPSLDRIVPSLGYVKGNVKFIANKWNTWKSNMLLRDLELIIAYMEKHLP